MPAFKFAILSISLFLTPCFAGTKSKASHREHSAHEHGSANLAIAFDGLNGKVEFRGAAESILGFEHKARSTVDKKILATAVENFEQNISRFVQFESELNCVFSKQTIGQVPEKGEESSGEHSDWSATYTVNCKKNLEGSKVTIDFTSFKSLKEVDVTILLDKIQKSAEFKSKPLIVELK